MSKRIIIWVVVALAGVGVVLALQHIKRTEMEQEGRVTYHKRSGDLIQFLVQELRQYGGTVTVTGGAPVMRAEWRYAEDTNGFQILIAQSHRAELVECFTSAFGEPLLRDQYPHLVYKEDRLGVGIVANLQSDPIHIICLRRGALFR
jgi:hypothetical protein